MSSVSQGIQERKGDEMTKKVRKYRVIPTKKQLIMIKEGWKLFQEITDAYYKNVSNIEHNLSKNTGIKEVEFFWCDNECVGIGNVDRTMKLIQREELEK